MNSIWYRCFSVVFSFLGLAAGPSGGPAAGATGGAAFLTVPAFFPLSALPGLVDLLDLTVPKFTLRVGPDAFFAAFVAAGLLAVFFTEAFFTGAFLPLPVAALAAEGVTLPAPAFFTWAFPPLPTGALALEEAAFLGAAFFAGAFFEAFFGAAFFMAFLGAAFFAGAFLDAFLAAFFAEVFLAAFFTALAAFGPFFPAVVLLEGGVDFLAMASRSAGVGCGPR